MKKMKKFRIINILNFPNPSQVSVVKIEVFPSFTRKEKHWFSPYLFQSVQ